MKLKVCGMKYTDNMIEVAQLQPDYLGFIFYEKSPRFFNGTIPSLPKAIKKVGVFVNASIEDIIEKVNTYNLDAIQLHGNESPEFCNELKRHYEECQFERRSLSRVIERSRNEVETSREQNDDVISFNETDCHSRRPDSDRNHLDRNDRSIEIIKVFSIKDDFNFEILKPYENLCDYYLFDTKGKLPGGNGYAFNWEVLKDYPSKKPFFLSGGIGLGETENVLSFLQKQESKYCYAIDINSKFETEPGMKHTELLKKFKDTVITRNEMTK